MRVVLMYCHEAGRSDCVHIRVRYVVQVVSKSDNVSITQCEILSCVRTLEASVIICRRLMV